MCETRELTEGRAWVIQLEDPNWQLAVLIKALKAELGDRFAFVQVPSHSLTAGTEVANAFFPEQKVLKKQRNAQLTGASITQYIHQ